MKDIFGVLWGYETTWGGWNIGGVVDGNEENV
jgi:hypothetical protein